MLINTKPTKRSWTYISCRICRALKIEILDWFMCEGLDEATRNPDLQTKVLPALWPEKAIQTRTRRSLIQEVYYRITLKEKKFLC